MTLIINSVMQRWFYASKRVNYDGTNRGADEIKNIKIKIIPRCNINKIEYKQKE